MLFGVAGLTADEASTLALGLTATHAAGVAARLVHLTADLAQFLLIGMARECRAGLAAEIGLARTALPLLAGAIVVGHLAEFLALRAQAARRRRAGAGLSRIPDLAILALRTVLAYRVSLSGRLLGRGQF